jgi:hypothetical protein
VDTTRRFVAPPPYRRLDNTDDTEETTMRREQFEVGARWVHRRARRQDPEGQEVELVEHLGRDGVRVRRRDGTVDVVRSGDLVAAAGEDFEALRGDEEHADTLRHSLRDDRCGLADEHAEAARLVLGAVDIDGITLDWRQPSLATADLAG